MGTGLGPRILVWDQGYWSGTKGTGLGLMVLRLRVLQITFYTVPGTLILFGDRVGLDGDVYRKKASSCYILSHDLCKLWETFVAISIHITHSLKH